MANKARLHECRFRRAALKPCVFIATQKKPVMHGPAGSLTVRSIVDVLAGFSQHQQLRLLAAASSGRRYNQVFS